MYGLDVRVATRTIAEGGAHESSIDHEHAREMFYPDDPHADEVFATPASAI
jgi:hypothetical protein